MNKPSNTYIYFPKSKIYINKYQIESYSIKDIVNGELITKTGRTYQLHGRDHATALSVAQMDTLLVELNEPRRAESC